MISCHVDGNWTIGQLQSQRKKVIKAELFFLRYIVNHLFLFWRANSGESGEGEEVI